MGRFGFRRACSQQFVIQTPKAPDTYSQMLFTIAQDEVNLISKDLSDFETTETSVIVNLNQQETALFKTGLPAYAQLRCYAAEYDAPGSAEYQLEVWPALDDTILGE